MRRLIWMVIFLMPAFCLGQTTEDAWGNLKQLRAGQRIEVMDMNLKSLKGTFVSYSEEAISLRTNKGEVGVPRGDVLRVTLREGSKRGRNMLICTAIGAAGGLAAGYGLMEREQGYAGAVAGSAVFLAAVGTGIGALLPAGTPTIYRAPRRRAEAPR